jgi:hypothetical protein
MELCWHPLSLGAIRLQSLSQLVKMIITLSTSLWAMSTHQFVVLIEMLLPYWAFWPFQKVRLLFFYGGFHTSYHEISLASRDNSGCADFRKFRRQLFHTSLEHILSSVKPFMTMPRVTLCPDGHFRRVVYSLGPYIADYPEQALLSCIVQGWCPRHVLVFSILLCLLTLLHRCTAPADNLDGPGAGRRSQEHTETLAEGCTLKEMWDNYGIVADLTVGIPTLLLRTT